MKKPLPNREYFMARFNHRKVPVRVAAAAIAAARQEAREWWIVTAPSAAAARAVCLLWPRGIVLGPATITSHGRNNL